VRKPYRARGLNPRQFCLLIAGAGLSLRFTFTLTDWAPHDAILPAMATNAERLYHRLRTPKDVLALKGQTEDGDFECKEWRPERSAGESIAKAACGFTNATGGVIVIGMIAKAGSNGIDVVQEESPIDDAEAVRSKIEDIISKLVEPGIEGIQSKSVRFPKSKSGFVVVLTPESDGSPHRSTIHKDFFVRVGPNTIPMAYFQIADRFGRRPHPHLRVEVTHVAFREILFQSGTLERTFALAVVNEGRGLARFPAVRYQRVGDLSLPNTLRGESSLWTLSDANAEWPSFRGGANDVVYPEERLKIATLVHPGARVNRPSPRSFPDITVTTYVVCEGMPAHRQTFSFAAIEAP
jgi:hypothetical protein